MAPSRSSGKRGRGKLESSAGDCAAEPKGSLLSGSGWGRGGGGAERGGGIGIRKHEGIPKSSPKEGLYGSKRVAKAAQLYDPGRATD